MRKSLLRCVLFSIVTTALFSLFSVTASAATEEDVLNAIRDKGGNEKLVNLAKSCMRVQFSKEGNTYTYDDALNMVLSYEGSIAQEWRSDFPENTDVSLPVEQITEVNSPAETQIIENPVLSEYENPENPLDFSNMSTQEKLETISIASAMATEWGINISVEQVAYDRFTVSVIDDDGFVINSTDIGTQIDKTGIDYRIFAVICTFCILFSIGGIAILYRKYLKS